MSFGTRLLSCMRAEGVTATELSDRTGLCKTNISHLVHDDRAPSYKTLMRILAVLRSADARWLITGKH